MSTEKKDKDNPNDPSKFQPVTDKAKAEAIEWAIRPQNKQDMRTFSSVGGGSPYLLSAVTSIYNYIKQLLEAEIKPYCSIHKEFHSEKEFKPDCKFTGQLSFELDLQKEDMEMKGFIDELLLLSPAVKGRRAETIIDMVKNMNRPSFNPMGMISGMMGGNTESPDDLIEEVPAINGPGPGE